MAYTPPARGQLNWDTDLNNSLDALHTASSDSGVAGYVNDTASSTRAAVANVVAGRTSVTLSATYPTLKAAIAALPAGGGTVFVPEGRWPSGNWTYDTDYMNKPNVRILGARRPRLSANADRLEAGSVIYGRFNAFADGLEVTDVGFDTGKYVIDTYYGAATTHAADHPLGGTWDAFAFAQPNEATPLAARRDVRLSNVISLLRDSDTVGHGVLMEGIDGGTTQGVVIGVGGVHGVVVKSKNMRMHSLHGWSSSGEGVIFKADTYADCGHLVVDTIESLTVPPGVSPWFTPTVAQHGLMLNPGGASFSGPVQIGRVKVFGATRGLGITGGASAIVSDVQIGELMADGYTGSMAAGIDFYTCRALRVQIGRLIVNSAQQGIAWNTSTVADAGVPLDIGSAELTNMTTRAINASGYGRIKIDTLRITTSPQAYYIENNARVMVGKETLASVTNKWERVPPGLAANWSNLGSGNSTFDVVLENHGVSIKGLLSAAAGAAGVFATLPAYLCPTENKRFPGYWNNGGTRKALMVGVATGGNVDMNDATAPTAGDYISVDGINWRHY